MQFRKPEYVWTHRILRRRDDVPVVRDGYELRRYAFVHGLDPDKRGYMQWHRHVHRRRHDELWPVCVRCNDVQIVLRQQCRLCHGKFLFGCNGLRTAVNSSLRTLNSHTNALLIARRMHQQQSEGVQVTLVLPLVSS